MGLNDAHHVPRLKVLNANHHEEVRTLFGIQQRELTPWALPSLGDGWFEILLETTDSALYFDLDTALAA